MSRYAEGTSVSVEKSRAEIEGTLRRYGATGFLSGWDEDRAFVAFMKDGRQVKFIMGIPRRTEKRFTEYKRGHTVYERDPKSAYAAWEQACRQRWRALALVIKAKLEAVAAGITVFEDEFLAHIVMPDGKTVAEHVRPALQIAYESGTMPKLLPDYSRPQ